MAGGCPRSSSGCRKASRRSPRWQPRAGHMPGVRASARAGLGFPATRRNSCRIAGCATQLCNSLETPCRRNWLA
eukprot:8314602-Alexandrium_andersonii.AAC.1